MKFRLAVVTSSVTSLVALMPGVVSAQDFTKKIGEGVKSAAEPAGLAGGPALPVLIGNVIGTLLSLVGVLLLVLLIYAGFLYMTASGNMEQVKKAQGMIRNAIIGLIIIVAAYAITNFVLSGISGAATGVTGV